MKKSELRCNYCGCSKFDKRKEKQTQFEPYGDKIEFIEDIWICKNCGEELNYTYNYTDKYEKAQRKSETSSINNILRFFNEIKVRFKDVEDSLSLPSRTLSRWKNRMNYSKIGLTLLRIVRSYPWIIYVAARRFDKKVVDEAFKQAAIDKFDLVEKENQIKVIYCVSARKESDFPSYNTPIKYGARQTNFPASILKKELICEETR